MPNCLMARNRFAAAKLGHAARMTLYETFVEHVRPVFEKLVGEGLIGAWGLTVNRHQTRTPSDFASSL